MVSILTRERRGLAAGHRGVVNGQCVPSAKESVPESHVRHRPMTQMGNKGVPVEQITVAKAVAVEPIYHPVSGVNHSALLGVMITAHWLPGPSETTATWCSGHN